VSAHATAAHSCLLLAGHCLLEPECGGTLLQARGQLSPPPAHALLQAADAAMPALQTRLAGAVEMTPPQPLAGGARPPPLLPF